MNKIILLGRLVKEAELKSTQSGKSVAVFTLAVDRPFAGQDGKREADFINCQLWGKSAEVLAKTVSKGQRVLVDGRLQIRSYTAKDGSKRYVTEVVCNSFEYIERKADGDKLNTNSQELGFENMGQQMFNEENPF